MKLLDQMEAFSCVKMWDITQNKKDLLKMLMVKKSKANPKLLKALEINFQGLVMSMLMMLSVLLTEHTLV